MLARKHQFHERKPPVKAALACHVQSKGISEQGGIAPLYIPPLQREALFDSLRNRDLIRASLRDRMRACRDMDQILVDHAFDA